MAFKGRHSVKERVAGILRQKILSGSLRPGDPIVEAKWAGKLRVAQASVREALNILATEGFVQKEGGRSAYVTQLSERDVVQIYQFRASIEGLAAKLVAASRPDLDELEQAIADMRSAAQQGNVRAYFEHDLRFHLLLYEKSGNRFLLEHGRRLIVPLFAFILIRQESVMEQAELWEESVASHIQILAALRSGDPSYAERQLVEVTQNFSDRTLVNLRKLQQPQIEWHSWPPQMPTLAR